MSIDAMTVKKIAKLARIRLSEGEVGAYVRELSAMMHWIEQLSEVPDDGGEAVASVTQHALPMRSDVVTDGEIPEAIIANAPKSEYGCFVVPKVIDQG
jgi:aspartyl-tRNA(Asn)/glutamyl-tRNA(Gln) amidotransferase subunit C